MNSHQPLKSVFVGSTIADLHDFRVRIEETLKFEQLTVRLSEDWVGSYGDTIARCRQRLAEADGYLGIFGYFYGSVPPGQNESITHLEFHWSLEKWGASASPHVAVFMPGTAYPLPAGQECEARLVLREKAEACLDPLSREERARHDERLQRFHKEVTQPVHQWRAVNWFKDLAELLIRVSHTCRIWRGDLFAAADSAAGQGPTPSTPRVPTPTEFGRLGRGEHLDACEDIHAQLQFANAEVPGVAILVCGNEDAGHGHYLDAVLELPILGDGRPPRRLRPPMPGYGLAELIQSVASEAVAVSAGGQPITTLDRLAEGLHRTLKQQAITLVVDQIGQLDGGLTRFQRDFWRPLFERLVALRANAEGQRLVLLVTAYTEPAAAWEPAVLQWRQGVEIDDWKRLIALPVLSPLSKADVRRWMIDLGVPDQPAGHRNRILQAVLTNANNEPDGTPLRVFERLRRERLWPEEDP